MRIISISSRVIKAQLLDDSNRTVLISRIRFKFKLDFDESFQIIRCQFSLRLAYRRYNTIKRPLEEYISELANPSSEVRERNQTTLTRNLSELEADILAYFDPSSPNYMPEVRYREICRCI